MPNTQASRPKTAATSRIIYNNNLLDLLSIEEEALLLLKGQSDSPKVRKIDTLLAENGKRQKKARVSKEVGEKNLQKFYEARVNKEAAKANSLEVSGSVK